MTMGSWGASDTAGVLVGAAAAGASLAILERGGRPPSPATSLAGLVGAAAIYPLARTRLALDRASLTELASLGAYTLAGARLRQLNSPWGLRLIGLAWATHAAFDLHHDVGSNSRIPDWYPAACAGYDVGIAAHLIGRAGSVR